MMAIRATGRSHILTARSVHPEYREVLHTYTQHQGIPLDEFGYDAESGLLDFEDLDRAASLKTPPPSSFSRPISSALSKTSSRPPRLRMSMARCW